MFIYYKGHFALNAVHGMSEQIRNTPQHSSAIQHSDGVLHTAAKCCEELCEKLHTNRDMHYLCMLTTCTDAHTV